MCKKHQRTRPGSAEKRQRQDKGGGDDVADDSCARTSELALRCHELYPRRLPRWSLQRQSCDRRICFEHV